MEVDYLPSCDRIKLYLSKGLIVRRQTLRSTGHAGHAYFSSFRPSVAAGRLACSR